MGNRIELIGASGQAYSFLPLLPDGAVKPVGVTYAIAEQRDVGWFVLAVGETNNLAARDWEARLTEVQRRYPAAQLLVRLNVALRVRLEEVADLVDALPRRPHMGTQAEP